MMEPGSMEQTRTEKEVFQQLLQDFREILQRNNINCDLLTLKKGKEFSSVRLDSSLVFRLVCRENERYFIISENYWKCFSESIDAAPDPKLKNSIRVPFHLSQALFFSQSLCRILDQVIDEIPKEFDCCSRYLACSDAKRCVNPNQDLALRCGYKRIMKRGRIFYGKNRNIE